MTSDRRKKLIHTGIGIALMVLFCILPPLQAEITKTGMRVLGIFIGTLYMWITVGSLGPSLICAAALIVINFSGTEGVSGVNYVLNSLIGNSTMMLILFIMIASGALEHYGVTTWIAHRILAMKALKGHPWRLITAVTLTSYLMSLLINPFTPIFLFFPILEEIYRTVGYEKGQPAKEVMVPKLLLVLVVSSAVIGYAVPPYMGTPLALISMFETLSDGAETISQGSYMAAAFLTGLAMNIFTLLVCRFVFRPDTERLKQYVSAEKSEALNTRQKILMVAFIIMILFMLVPSLLPQSNTVIAYLAKCSSAMPLFFTAILACVLLSDGPALNVQTVMSKHFNWSTYFLCGAAILIGNALTNKSTGISACLTEVLGPVFTALPPIVFLIAAVVLCCIVTNFCNSLVVMMVMEPLIRTYCNLKGIPGVSIALVITMITLMSALFTPAASPFAAVLHGNSTWLEKQDKTKYTAAFVAAELLAVLLIGIPVTVLFNGSFM